MTESRLGADGRLIRMIDQHGRVVAIDALQDGGPLGPAAHGRRVRFKIRVGAGAGVLAYRVEQIALEDCEHWHVYDIRVGGKSQLLIAADSPDGDGFPGVAFAKNAVGCLVSFDTCKIGMDLALDVAYLGPEPGGAPLGCSLRCTVVYESDVMAAENLPS